MNDPEIEAIRQQRMAQMQQQQYVRTHDVRLKNVIFMNKCFYFKDPESQKKKEAQMEQQTQMKNSILAQLLDQDARARLNTLKISKPEKAEMVCFDEIFLDPGAENKKKMSVVGGEHDLSDGSIRKNWWKAR